MTKYKALNNKNKTKKKGKFARVRSFTRKKLQNIKFSGHSDTESLIEAISYWGLEKTLEKVNGMFAFALWDKKLKLLHLVRDRFGEKPLYYGWVNQTLFFASGIGIKFSRKF